MTLKEGTKSFARPWLTFAQKLAHTKFQALAQIALLRFHHYHLPTATKRTLKLEHREHGSRLLHQRVCQEHNPAFIIHPVLDMM